MNKEFKKYFDKKMKDNTNKYVVMYKAILIFYCILILIALALDLYNYFNKSIPDIIFKIFAFILLMMIYPLYFIPNKIFKEENEVSRISKCKTKKDKIILKIYNITKLILLVGFAVLITTIALISDILGVFEYSRDVARICGYIFIGLLLIFEKMIAYLDKRNILW